MSDDTPIWVGLDVHRETISLAALRGSFERPLVTKVVSASSERHLHKELEHLRREGPLRVCYEASGFGYVLYRQLRSWGHTCALIAPSLIPRAPGDRIKTDGRDALKLAEMYRAGLLSTVHVPTEEDERARAVVRHRRALQTDIHRTQQRILKLLQARGHFYRERGKPWTQNFMAWLRTVPLEEEDQFILGQYLGEREVQRQLMQNAQSQVERVAQAPSRAGPIARLRCLRGIDTTAAACLVTEIVDVTRFASPRPLMAWAGLIPSEFSSGQRQWRGKITGTGNHEVRRVLVEAAWNNTRPPSLGRSLQARVQGQSAEVLAHARRAQERLYGTWKRLGVHNPRVAVTAMARQLLGFVFALWRARSEDLRARELQDER
jgi:transposase